jgi:hypothetical protein
MKRLLIIAAAVSAGCAGAGGPEPVPEGAENPIIVEFRSATPPDAVEVIARALSDEGIGTQEVDPQGYVETRWIDIAAWVRGVQAEAYPIRERMVQYRFEVTEAQGRTRRLTIGIYYQPNRPQGVVLQASKTYDRLVPTDHPAYQLALELRTRIRTGLRGVGATLVEGG